MPRTRSLPGTTAIKSDEIKKEAGDPEITGGHQEVSLVPTVHSSENSVWLEKDSSEILQTRSQSLLLDTNISFPKRWRSGWSNSSGTALERAGKGKRMKPKWG